MTQRLDEQGCRRYRRHMTGDSSARPLGLNAVDLFCGAGGLTEGFRTAGFDVTYALDWDADSCETYGLNHPQARVENVPITERSARSFAKMVGEVDVIVGGPSCQGFSTHGRRDPQDDRNSLWSHMRDLVQEINPRAFLMENVPGLVSHRDGHLRGQMLKEFQDLGFRVEAKILLAADYGVPQLRRRVFVVGVQEDLAFKFPDETHLGGWRRDSLDLWEAKRQEQGLAQHIGCGEILMDLPPLLDGKGDPTRYTRPSAPSDFVRSIRGKSKRLRDHEASPVGTKYAHLLPLIPPGGTWRDIPPHLLPDRFRGMRRTDSTNLLGRLDPRRPAYTITTQFNNVTAGCFTHPYEDRALSIREGARLQSFPDKYVFAGSPSSRCRQIGNAVPPRLAQHLAVAIAISIDDRSKPRRPRMVRVPKETDTVLQPPSPRTKERMKRQRRRDTVPETLIVEELAQRGLTFGTGIRLLLDARREADIFFERERLVVLIDGCFWHGCPTHSRPTKSNTKWWAEKIARNKKRDRETNRLLRKSGHEVIRVWEHETPSAAADRIALTVEKRRAGTRKARSSSPS